MSRDPVRRSGPGRRRDRHGRGPRGPLAPAAVPLSGTRADQFDDEVMAAVDRLLGALAPETAARIGSLDVVVRDVPLPATDPEGEVVLGDAVPPSGGRPAQVVVYRRPVELRAVGRPELRALLRDVAAEQVATLLGVDPAELDPDYPEQD